MVGTLHVQVAPSANEQKIIQQVGQSILGLDFLRPSPIPPLSFHPCSTRPGLCNNPPFLGNFADERVWR